MAQINSLIPINGRMDQDSEELTMRKGDHTYALNARFSDKTNAVYEAIGNAKAGNLGNPAGTYYTLGALDAGLYIFYAVSNLTTIQQIVRYNTVSSVHQIVVDETYLGFTVGNFVKFQYNEENDTLYWTDGRFGSFSGSVLVPLGHNPPRMVNVDKAIRYYNSGGTDPLGYSSMTEQHLDVIKYPSPFPASCIYTTDEDRKSNVLTEKMLQFSYQYIYEDNTRSTWSIWSEVALPVIHERDDFRVLLVGVDFNIPQFQNAVKITINTGHETVKKVRIAVRDQNVGVPGVFAEVDKVDLGLSNDVDHVVNYYGDEILTAVSFDDFYNHDLVPITANDQWLTSSRASSYNLVYGGVREGFDNPALDVDVSVFAHKFYPGNPWYGTLNTYFSVNTAVQVSTSGSDAIMDFVELNQLPTEHALFEQFALLIDMSFVGGGAGDEYFFLDDLKQHISTTSFGGVGLGYAIVSSVYDELVARGYTGITLSTTLPRITVSGVTPATSWIGKLNNYVPRRSSFKKGADHPIGIVYMDRGKRDGGVAKIGDVYVPFDREFVDGGQWPTGTFAIDTDEFRTSIRLLLNHQPPAWATHYAIVYQGNKRIGSFERRIGMGIKTMDGSSSRCAIYLDNYHYAVGDSQADYSPHEIQVGDIVRVVRDKEDLVAPYVRPSYSDYFELKVLEAGWNTHGAYFVIVDWPEHRDYRHGSLPGATHPYLGTNSGVMLEILTEKKSSDASPYHTISKVYEVKNPHTTSRLHGGEDLSGLAIRQIDFTSGSPYRIDVYGDYSHLIGAFTGRSITVSGSGSGNNGTYAISNVVLDDSSTVPVTQFYTLDATTADEFAGNKALASIATDQVIGSVPALCSLTRGDVYCRQISQRFRSSVIGILSSDPDFGRNIKRYMVESFHYTDRYISDSYDKGQPYAELGDLQGHRYRKDLIRNSLNYIEGTLVNGFSSFLSPNQASVAERDGDIVRLIQVGYTLKVIQKDRVSSIYLEASETTQLDGQNQLVNISRVLGSVRPQEEEYGTSHPYSVVKVDRDLYFWDVNRRAVIKNTPGGQIVISSSKYGMNSFINGRSVLVNTIVGGYDRVNEEVVWSFEKKGDADNTFTLGFDVIGDKWTSFYTGIAEVYVNSNDSDFYAFNAGNLYKMGVGNIREFYTAVGNFILDMVMNEQPAVKKVFDSHELGSNQVIDVNPVTVPADAENASGMETMIPSKMQEVNEGTVFGFYLMDRNSPGYGVGQEDLAMYEGRPIRGLMAKHRYIKTGASSDRLKITHIIVRATPSEPM